MKGNLEELSRDLSPLISPKASYLPKGIALLPTILLIIHTAGDGALRSGLARGPPGAMVEGLVPCIGHDQCRWGARNSVAVPGTEPQLRCMLSVRAVGRYSTPG